jgi:hypothetical protein
LKDDESVGSEADEEYNSSDKEHEMYARPDYKVQLYNKMPFIQLYSSRYGSLERNNDLIYVQDYLQKLVSYRQVMKAMGIDFDQNRGEYDVTSLI